MAARTTLSDLRNGIQQIYHEMMREQGQGEVSNAAVLEKVRAEKVKELNLLTPELVNMALTKLLNEVGSRKAAPRRPADGIDLFGEYRVPGIVTIVRGTKKDTAKLSFREAELYLKAHSEKTVSERHKPLRQLLEACRDYVESEEDTLEILIRRKRQAEQFAIH